MTAVTSVTYIHEGLQFATSFATDTLSQSNQSLNAPNTKQQYVTATQPVYGTMFPGELPSVESMQLKLRWQCEASIWYLQ